MHNVVTIRGSRWKSVLLFVVCAGFVAAALLAIRSHPEPALYFCVAFFGLGVAISLAAIVAPARLELADDGFTHSHLGRRWSVKWCDIDEMFLWSNPAASQKLVAWSHKPGRGPTGAIARASSALGVSGALPGMWTMRPKELLALMQQWRLRATAGT